MQQYINILCIVSFQDCIEISIQIEISKYRHIVTSLNQIIRLVVNLNAFQIKEHFIYFH